MLASSCASACPWNVGQASARARPTRWPYDLFFEFTAQQLKVRPSSLRLEQLDATRVQAFLEHLEKERHNSPATRNLRLAAIRAFVRFIEHREPAALDRSSSQFFPVLEG
jgi:hypothetical protein